FSSRRRHTRWPRDWSSDVCSSDLVDRGPIHVMLPSRLGFTFRGTRSLGDSVRIASSRRAAVDTTWPLPWGEVARVREHYNELRRSEERRVGKECRSRWAREDDRGA